MTNKNKNINELVTDDDDPTAELEALVLRRPDSEDELELDATTAGLNKSSAERPVDDLSSESLRLELQSRSDLNDRLQHDLTQLQAKWRGVEAENVARAQVNKRLNADLGAALASLKRKLALLKKRDHLIKSLRQEIRERNETYRLLQDQFEAMQRSLSVPQHEASAVDESAQLDLTGASPVSRLTFAELQHRYSQLENYADQLRRQIQDRSLEAASDNKTRDLLQQGLQDAQSRISSLESEITQARESHARVSQELAALHTAHADEIRTIRFELGTAQETVSQHEILTEQLASDLVETRSHRFKLESELSENQETNNSRIERLEKENLALLADAEELRQRVANKNEAINCLISELAKKTHRQEVIDDFEDAQEDPDDHSPERVELQARVDKDRITRVLVGSIDGQELRFPLFKNRLTIGRTDQNDIQLKASHVSRRHAVIVTDGNATRVIDWGSKNGIRVNKKRVKEHFLKNGDVVSIGTANFRYDERPKRDA